MRRFSSNYINWTNWTQSPMYENDSITSSDSSVMVRVAHSYISDSGSILSQVSEFLEIFLDSIQNNEKTPMFRNKNWNRSEDKKHHYD